MILATECFSKKLDRDVKPEIDGFHGTDIIFSIHPERIFFTLAECRKNYENRGMDGIRKLVHHKIVISKMMHTRQSFIMKDPSNDL